MQQSLLPTEPALKARPERTANIFRSLMVLMPAIFIGRVGWVGMKVTDTALLGHVNVHALTSSALWASCVDPPKPGLTGDCSSILFALLFASLFRAAPEEGGAFMGVAMSTPPLRALRGAAVAARVKSS